MPIVTNLRVPAAHQPALRLIADLPDDANARLQQALEGDGALVSTANVVERLRKNVPELEAVGAETFISMLFSLIAFHTAHSWSFDKVAQTLTESRQLNIDEERKPVFHSRLLAILGVKPLIALAKAVDVAGEQSHIFHTTRIVTDIRPVFGDDPSAGPLGAVMVHTLVLEHYDVDGGIKSFYIGLSDPDLKLLREAVDRAASKSESLRILLDRAGLQEVNPEVE